MEKILDESINYLEEIGDSEYQRFNEFGITELMIPKTATPIKNYVLKLYNLVALSNAKIRLLGMPLAKISLNSKIDPNILDSYFSYFKEEKETLKIVKKTLNSRQRKDEPLPIKSCCGIIIETIANIHLTNTSQMETIINAYNSNYNSQFEIILPNNITTPTNMELVKKIGTRLNSYIRK